MTRWLAVLLAVVLTAAGCSLIDRELPMSATAEVGADGFTLALDGVTVVGSAGVAAPGTPVEAQILTEPDLPDLEGRAEVVGPTVEVVLGDGLQPDEPIELVFATEHDDALAVLSETRDGEIDLFAVSDSSQGPTAEVDHLSIFNLVRIDVAAFWSGLSNALDIGLGVSTPEPSCPGEATVGGTTYEVTADPAHILWPCLSVDDDGMHLRITPATGVPYAVRTDPAGTFATTPGSSVGSMASIALFETLPDRYPTGLASPGGSLTVTTDEPPFRAAQARAHPASLLMESLVYGIDMGLAVWGVSALPWSDVGRLTCIAAVGDGVAALSDGIEPAGFTALGRALIGCAQEFVSDQAGQGLFSGLADRAVPVVLGIVGTGLGLVWSGVRGVVGEFSGEGLVDIHITGRAVPLDEAALLRAPVPSLCGHPAGTLVDGSLPGIAERDGHVSISRPDAEIPADRVVFGDVDGDGTVEAAVVVSCSRGGVPWPEIVVVYGPGPTYLGHVDLGDQGRDRPHVASLRMVDGRVEAQIVGFVGPGDGACCGRVDAVAQIVLTDGEAELASIRYFDERDTVAELIKALDAGDRAEVRRLNAVESIADFLFDSYAGTGLELDGCRVGDLPWGAVRCDVAVPGSDEAPLELYLNRVGFAQWEVEAFLSPRFVNY